jgi:hypothetical protein
MRTTTKPCLIIIWLLVGNICFAQTPVRVDIDLTKPTKPVSPYIYGKNNVLPSTFLNSGTTDEITKAREARVRFVRQGGGNNSTKYNWRLKLSSHPDWYNNVYSNDWDIAAKNMFDKLPGVQGMWSFQLLGMAASNANNNFADWSYNQSQWWSGVAQNLAGGGQPNKAGGAKATVEGNPNLYLMKWTADSTVGILDKWFGAKGLGYDKNKIRYWSMDNEPEIWSGTHDDVMKTQCSAEEFMQLYFKVAKAARAKYPEIKLSGPVPANEWQWYRWGNDGIPSDGRKYCWLEFFIKRIAEEEKASGIRLLDVLDIHYYPETSDAEKCVQLHRVFFDRNYDYPEANGVHTVNGGWDSNINKEYILGRCSDWLTKYMGANHGVGLAVTETGMKSTNANVQAVWYASTMGEFMKNGVEIFTPWSWDIGMWETLHLFSRYNQENYIQAASQNETLISAYPTINTTSDSMTVVLVNRSLSEKQTVDLNFSGCQINPGACPMYSISGLGSTETFFSHANNALKNAIIQATTTNISVELAPLSVNSITLKSLVTGSVPKLQKNSFKASAYPNPASDQSTLNFSLPEKSRMNGAVFNSNGQLLKTIINSVFDAGNHQVSLNTSGYPDGIYWIRFNSETNMETIKLIKAKNQ